MSKKEFQIIFEQINTTPQEIDRRIFEALSMLVSEEDIINYLNKKNGKQIKKN